MERWPAAGLAPKARRLRAAGFTRRLWRQVATVGGVAVAASLVLPATVSSAAVSRPQPSLASLVAQAKSLGHQIDVLSEQYDGLRDPDERGPRRGEDRDDHLPAGRHPAGVGAGRESASWPRKAT